MAEQQRIAVAGGGGDNQSKSRKSAARVSKAQLSDAVLAAKLSARDERVLGELARRKVLLGSHIRRLCYADLSEYRAVREQGNRLGQLVSLGFLSSATSAGKQVYYWLGQLGLMWARAEQQRVAAADARFFRHDLLVAEFMTEVLAESAHVGGQAEWVAEYELDSGIRRKVLPDAVGSVTDKLGRRLVFFLEIDRGTELYRVFGTKVGKYGLYQRKGDWRVRFERKTYPPILIVTSDGEARVAGLRREVELKMAKEEHPEALTWYFTNTARLAHYVGVLGLERTYGPLSAPVWSVIGKKDVVAIMEG